MFNEEQTFVDFNKIFMEGHKPWPKVAIIILNWNGWRDTIECLESLQRLNYPNYQIIVVDNGSTDDSKEKIKAWANGEVFTKFKFFEVNLKYKPVKVIEYDRLTAEAGGLPDLENTMAAISPNRRMVLIATEANLGFAGGNNVAIRYAMNRGVDYIWMLNNDTVVDEMALTKMVELAERDRRIGVVGSKLLFYDRPNVVQEAGGPKVILWAGLAFMKNYNQEDRNDDHAEKIDFVSGASSLIRFEAIYDVGLLDEEFFMYGEDLEWQIRAKARGWGIMYCPESRVWHKLGASSGGSRSPFHEYHTTRGMIRLVRRYSWKTLPIAIILNLLRCGRRVVRGETDQALAIAKAIKDGLWNI